jgi:hypothetical protein
MRYILVNGRTPSGQPLCARCCEHIGANYLKEIGTRLFYCDPECYADHCISAALALASHARVPLTIG